MDMSQQRELALFPLNVVLFPGMTLPLRIFEPRYLQMVTDCMNDDGVFGVVCIKAGPEVGGVALPYAIGTTARIIDVEEKSPDLLHITTVGQARFRTHRLIHGKPYLVGEVDAYPLTKVDAPEVGALIDVELSLLSGYLGLLARMTDVRIQLRDSPDSPEAMAYLIAMLLEIPLPMKQHLLSITDLPTLLHEEAILLRSNVSALTVMLNGAEVQNSRPDFSQN
jgi:Lon protease-like protein